MHSIAAGEHALPQAAHGRRETLGSDAVSGRVTEVIHLPSNSWLPLVAGLLAALCTALLLKAYLAAPERRAQTLGRPSTFPGACRTPEPGGCRAPVPTVPAGGIAP